MILGAMAQMRNNGEAFRFHIASIRIWNQGVVGKVPFQGIKAPPPYPPLSGGQEKTKAPLSAVGAAFFYPPVKGG